MVALLLGPGIVIWSFEGHSVQILAGSHWLPLAILKDKWMNISESSIGLLSITATSIFIGLFLWQRRAWVLFLTTGYVFGQIAILLLLTNIGPLQM